MANDFVAIDRTARFGNLLIQIADRLRSVREDVIEAKERMDHMNDGSNFAPISANFGIPATPTATAAGQAAFNVISAAETALNDAAIITLIQRLG